MASSTMIHFFFQDVTFNLRDRISLKTFISMLFRKERKTLKSLNYIFCTDKEILRMNRVYLKHDYYTDIISFDLSVDAGAIEGEIYISIERVRENARKFGTTIQKELLRVIFHGALHLCGFQDKTLKQKAEMRRKEEFYLISYKNDHFT